MFGGVLPKGIESLSYGVSFWRLLTNWLGGMGIVVLSIAILPLLNIGGQMLYNAESTGVKSQDSQITPRITSSAKILWSVYLLFTGVGTVLLMFGGMSWFDAVCHMFSAVSTGGFSPRQAGPMYYNSAYIDWVLIFFMFMSSCNFVLHYRAIMGHPRDYWKDDEFRLFCWIVGLSTLIITLSLTFTEGVRDSLFGTVFYGDFWTSLRFAAFQVVSIVSTTGYASSNYCDWPSLTCAVLFLLMFVGGCGGCTAGGIKCVRLLLLGKISYAEIKRSVYPHMVPNVQLNGVHLESGIQQKAIAFFALYISSFLGFVLIYPLLCPSMSLETSIAVSLTSLSNIGPGFGQISPAYSCAWISAPAKLVMAFEMILGRLELYTLLVVLNPFFWKK